MPEKTENTRRIAKNTLFLYFRSLFSLFVSLYSSRLILQALGVDNYGIYNAVGGFVSMFWLVSGSLSTAISRFLNYEMGRKDEEKLAKVFSMSLIIMIILSAVVLLLAETVGIWFLNERMTIPPGREKAAFWVFQLSVLTVMSGFTVSPFNSAIISHEKMGVYAYIGITEVCLRLAIALFLAYGHYRSDELILYALLWFVVTISLQIFTRAYAVYHFKECRLRWVFDKGLFKELFGFASWSFLGSISGTLSGQGINMILNVVFGPAVNTARGLASTVNQVVMMFINNFTLALNPQVTQSYASGDTDYMKSLIYRGTRFSFYILFIIAFPLILETRFVISLWLNEVPAHTVNFVRLLLITNINIILAIIFAMGIRASGKIQYYQICTCSLAILEFALAYVMMHAGFAPEWIYFISIFITTVSLIATLLIFTRLLKVSILEIVKNVYLKVVLVALTSVIIPIPVFLSMDYGWPRLLTTVPLCIACCAASIYWIGCNPSERALIISYFRKVLSRIGFGAN